jgi:hypothetical protein
MVAEHFEHFAQLIPPGRLVEPSRIATGPDQVTNLELHH